MGRESIGRLWRICMKLAEGVSVTPGYRRSEAIAQAWVGIGQARDAQQPGLQFRTIGHEGSKRPLVERSERECPERRLFDTIRSSLLAAVDLIRGQAKFLAEFVHLQGIECRRHRNFFQSLRQGVLPDELKRLRKLSVTLKAGEPLGKLGGIRLGQDRKSTRLNSSHVALSRMPS